MGPTQVPTSSLFQSHRGCALVLLMTALLSFKEFRSHTLMLITPRCQKHQIMTLVVRESIVLLTLKRGIKLCSG